MPPLPTPSSQASGHSWLTHPSEHRYLLEGIVLWSLLATACRSIVVLVARRKNKMTRSRPSQSDPSSNPDEKRPPFSHQRKDSYLDDLSNPPTIKQEDKDTTMGSPVIKQEQSIQHNPTNPSLPTHPNTYLDSLKQETLRPAFIPVYPWIAPPKPLPGPYDAPYYPLPLPTLQTEKSFYPTETQSPAIKKEEDEEELGAASYTRHIPPHSLEERQAVLQGAVIVSSKGWRRTHWTVIAG